MNVMDLDKIWIVNSMWENKFGSIWKWKKKIGSSAAHWKISGQLENKNDTNNNNNNNNNNHNNTNDNNNVIKNGKYYRTND